MVAQPLCRECDGTGWIPYHSETLDGELEEAYMLCPSCYAPRRCTGSKSGHPCPRPSTVRYGSGYYCKEHIEVTRAEEEADQADEAIYLLRCWLQVARTIANEFLEIQLSEGLGKAKTRLRRVEQELAQTRKRAGDPD